MLDLTRLSMLKEFAQRGTIAEAADAMGYTSSAVSQQLSTLEREAGVPLTVRTGRRLRLTPAGERLVARADELLSVMERAEAELRTESGAVGGTVRLAVFQSAALALIPRALQALAQSHPGVRVNVTQSEPGAALAETWARDFDLVVAEEYPHHSAPHYPDMVRSTLVRDEIRLCVAGPWEEARALGDVASAPWVMEPRGTATRHFAEQACRLAGFEPDVRFESADLQSHAAFISAGLAVGLLPGLMWARPELVSHARPLSPAVFRGVFTAARAVSATDPAVVALRRALEEAARSVGGEDATVGAVTPGE
ncbi:LysR family transcriptional regulator [Demequina zhanjiangensis]|uniref:LysR family transcriptional regulator n=1 Tax=Demequina zhanjiangensis TaxID=3051659 RepID=A0ABT8G2C0_9MICO|nr:LysR family transcriptional regulator [Demequina sp. SYSU T00b26]MDN4473294.1 LysR family transcriptional regulator [Demequina sp. SYSU T00b26]